MDQAGTTLLAKSGSKESWRLTPERLVVVVVVVAGPPQTGTLIHRD